MAIAFVTATQHLPIEAAGVMKLKCLMDHAVTSGSAVAKKGEIV